MSEPSTQVRQESADSVIRKLHEIMQSWKNRITLDNLRISERFAAGELRVIVHFTVDDSDEVWAACFEREEFPGVFGLNEGQPSNRDKNPVLVGIVQLMDLPQRFIPTSVRLEKIDSLYRLWPHSIYFSSGLLGFVSLLALRNREPGFFRKFVSCSDANQLICEMVKRTPEVMDYVSGNSEGIDWIYRDRNFRLEGFPFSSLRIALRSESCALQVQEGPESRFKIHEVLFGPFDLHPNQREPL